MITTFDLTVQIKVGFSQTTYLCEHATAYRNRALLYFMQEAGVFKKVGNFIMIAPYYYFLKIIVLFLLYITCLVHELRRNIGFLPSSKN